MAVVINAEKRDEKKNPRQLRAEGKLTATVYGKGVESISIEVNEKDFMTVYNKDKTGVFDLKLADKSMNVKVQELQKNYRTGANLNVEFVTVQ